MYRRQPGEKQRNLHLSPRQASRFSIVNALVLVLINLIQVNNTAIAQSVGYQPALNFGFNPHLSPVFGYGLGLPYGAYSFSPLQSPLLASSLLLGAGGHHENSFLSKIHAKSFLKKFAYSPFYSGYYYPGSYKSKLALMKHPELAYSPYGAEYGFGKHYGSALIPNNPYKSTYGDYYGGSASNQETAAASNGSPSVAESSTSTSTTQVAGDIYFNNHQQQPFNEQASFAQYGHQQHHNYDDQGHLKKALIKPLIKAGVLLTTAAFLGKKSLEHGVFPAPSLKLNPAGMIGNIKGDN